MKNFNKKKHGILLIISLIIVFIFLLIYVFVGIMFGQKEFNFLLSCNNKNITPVKNFKIKKDLDCSIFCGSDYKKIKINNLDVEQPTILIGEKQNSKIMNKISDNKQFLILQKISNGNEIENLVLDKETGVFSFTSTYNLANSFPGMPISESSFVGYRGFCY